ncbi:DUF4097 family beta strand repeat-containing protein [Cecembia sp.]|uniref:DUF4097 family beta strand repeat-containing protein n=2 Tax=Cecembia sp. TaxID=1898110 RepID=UPI0025B850D7|nr:DUF4097 family beta strand repeat-containing protein [Cecembia sp.]
MKKYSTGSLLILFCLILGIPMQAFAQMKTLVDTNKSFTGITKIEVSGGALDIYFQGKQQEEVNVEAFLESTYHDQDIVFVKVGNVLKISHEVNNNRSAWNNVRTKGHIKIQGPREMGLDMAAGSGTLHASQAIASEIKMRVGSGKINGQDLKGNIEVRAGSGSIHLAQVVGDVAGYVGSGNSEMKEINGNVKYSSSSGRLIASNIDGMMEVNLTSGSAKLDNVAELGPLKLTSGSINAQNVGLGESTGIYGTSGNFKIQTHSNLKDFNFHLNATSGNLRVGNSQSRRSLAVDNGSDLNIKGNITSGNISIQN